MTIGRVAFPEKEARSRSWMRWPRLQGTWEPSPRTTSDAARETGSTATMCYRSTRTKRPVAFADYSLSRSLIPRAISVSRTLSFGSRKDRKRSSNPSTSCNGWVSTV